MKKIAISIIALLVIGTSTSFSQVMSRVQKRGNNNTATVTTTQNRNSTTQNRNSNQNGQHQQGITVNGQQMQPQKGQQGGQPAPANSTIGQQNKPNDIKRPQAAVQPKPQPEKKPVVTHAQKGPKKVGAKRCTCKHCPKATCRHRGHCTKQCNCNHSQKNNHNKR